MRNVSWSNTYWSRVSNWLVLLALGALLAACGGGGGDPTLGVKDGANAGVGSVVLVAGATTIVASGADGTEVVLTAVVKNPGNNAMTGQTVTFTASSGTISNTNRVTDANGTVTEKLSVKGDASLRDITIKASSGGVESAPVVVKVVPVTSGIASLLLTSSGGTLASSGGTAVNMIAFVKDANNAIVPNASVTFSADSGALGATKVNTNALGQAQVSLNTGGDASLRTIKVTASAGAQTASTDIGVSGTRLVINAFSTVNLKTSTDMVVKLVDSSGNPLVGKPVTFSARSNALTVKGGGASPALTDNNGQLVLSYNAQVGSSDSISVKAQGDSVVLPIAINASNFTINAVSGSNVALSTLNTNTCYAVTVHSDVAGVPQTGNVRFSTSRGAIYQDAACGTPLQAPLALVGGNAIAYVQASGAGLTALTAKYEGSGALVQSEVEFVAPLTAQATISLQADPAVIGANTVGSTAQRSALRAVVRDGSVENNLVKNAQVSFSIQADASNGSLSSPSLVTTDSDGVATVSYIAGQGTTGVDGVVVKAQLQGVSSNAAAVKLTVTKKSLFISAGSGNALDASDSSTYRKTYSVFVTDAAGNPVPDVIITAAAWPRYYYKGYLQYSQIAESWIVVRTANACDNEDRDRSGTFNPNNDFNLNGRLDPGIPLNLSTGGKTDSSGTAIVTLTYPRDRANWLDVELTIRGNSSGTEATYVGYTLLPGLATDFNRVDVSPPGVLSPYGQATDCRNPN
ncbi:Ig-like domain-containing protein [Janthinobacterium sp. SUN211]|uniref:Ig-like domain-containing protein n=1 Tax=Janthinobacterium sp. SUN211 TaxID=3014786 RepID=UPI002712AEB3|nr:Ig-like domain-containing protein [Janthinobacterium sp. SUN211]MDO8049520.1 Ig-like domain-containing protein [Janthinobacterium sp. SUN211]